MRPARDDRLRFGPFELDASTLELRRDGKRVRLAPQPARLLALLAARPGQLVSREEIREHVWGALAVEFDSGLHTCIRQIRHALDDDPQEPRYIETIPRRGYRFLAGAVTPAAEPDARPKKAGMRVVLLASVAVVAVSTLAVMTQRRGGSVVPEPPPRLVVLPFASLVSGADSPYVAEGLAEEIRTDLARVGAERLEVIGRLSSERYRGAGTSMERIVGDLDVTHVLEGSLRQAPRGLIVSARLVQAADRTQVWADRFEVEPTHGLDPVVEIASRVAAALAVELDRKGRGGTGGEVPVEARDAFLEARYLFYNEQAEGAEARLRKAIELAPDYAEAHGVLAEVLQATARRDEAERHAKRAIEMDPMLAPGYRVLGHVALERLDGTSAGRRYEEAMRVAPDDPESRMAYGHWLLIADRPEEAIAQLQQASRIDPVSPLIRSDLPWAYFYARRYDEADAQAVKSLELLPELISSRTLRIWIEIARGDHDAAKRRLLEYLPAIGATADNLATVEAMDPAESVKFYLRKLLSLRQRQEPRPHSRLAESHVLLGDLPASMRELELSLERREPSLAYVPIDPRFDALNGDPRFTAFLRNVRGVLWAGG